MRELKVNLWTAPADAIAITTNGIVKSNGALVMGGGCAKEAALKFPDLPKLFGDLVKRHGNHVHYAEKIGAYVHLFSFPTKHHYSDPSDLSLIEQSCRELFDAMELFGLESVAVPRPGCGLGGLNWESQVKPICEKYFDDRFIVVDFPDHYISRNR